MSERERGGGDIEILHRMITYVREEAIRLRVMDVAMLLEHAQEAVTTFASDPSMGCAGLDRGRDADHVEH